MPSATCDVIFEGRRNSIKFNNHMKFTEVESKIREVFEQIREQERFHLVLYKNKKEYEIKNDDDLKLLVSSTPIGKAVQAIGNSHKMEIRVYPGGPFSIWLRDEEHPITKVPASNTYLMHIARIYTFPDFSNEEFEDNLHKLMHSIKLASFCIVITENRRLSFALSNMGNDNLKPAIDHCTKTFCVVHDKNTVVLRMITDVITKLRDGLEHLVKAILEKIGEQATKIEAESQECIANLVIVEDKLREVLVKVQEAILEDDDRRQQIVVYLEDTLRAIRKIQTVMNDMKTFWSNVKVAIESLSSSTLMTDISVSVASPAAGLEEKHKRMARHLWRTKRFKLNGIAFIAKHAAIRDICHECMEPMKELRRNLSRFLEKDLPSVHDARQMYEGLQEAFRQGGRERQIVIDGEMDDGTVADFKDALGVPYDNNLRVLTSIPVQVTLDVDLEEDEYLSSPVEVAGDGRDLVADTLNNLL